MIRTITFHGIGPMRPGIDDYEAAMWVSEERFVEIAGVCRGRDEVQITFDDSNRSDVDIALPVLIELGLRAEFFILAGRIGTEGYLGRADLRRLGDAGMSIGSHGMHHRRWRGLSPAQLDEEVVTAREVLEREIGAPIDRAACPFGCYDRRSLSALRRAGFRRVYTSDGGASPSDAWLQSRTSIRSEDTAESVRAMLSSSPGFLTSLGIAAKRFMKRWR